MMLVGKDQKQTIKDAGIGPFKNSIIIKEMVIIEVTEILIIETVDISSFLEAQSQTS